MQHGLFIVSKKFKKHILFFKNHNFNKKLLNMVKVEGFIVSITFIFCLCNKSSNKKKEKYEG